METPRQALARKIRALLAKTQDAGASEAEALAAAEKAKELLDRYQMDLTELEVREEGTVHLVVPSDKTSLGIKVALPQSRAVLVGGIAKFTGTRMWVEVTRSPRKTTYGSIHIVGLASDAEFASWLLDSLSLFNTAQFNVWTHSLAFLDIEAGMAKQAKFNFVTACAQRINDRLRELAEKPAAPTGTSLIVLKNQLVEEAFKATGVKLTLGRRDAVAGLAAGAGTEAGNRATFGRPVSRGTQLRLAK